MLFKIPKFARLAVAQRRAFHISAVQRMKHVPIVVEDEGQGERAYDIFSRLLRARIICLFGPIDTQVSSTIIAQLLFLSSEDGSKPIDMYINSPGGEVSAGLAIYDTMQLIRPPVATWCVGEAMSMGSLLLASGAPEMRRALPNSRIMVHQPLGGAQGQITDMQIRLDEMQRMKKQLNNIYVKHTKQPLEVIERSLDRDNFLTPEEAKDFGLIDHIGQ